jgi:uncharacterized protein YoxC
VSAGEVAALLAGVGVAVLVAFAVPVLVQLRRTLVRLEHLVARTEAELDPLVHEAQNALSQAVRAVSGVSALVEDASRLVRVTRAAVLQIINAPVANAVGVVEGIREALSVLFRKDRTDKRAEY